ncbi:MAG TPA: tetratricopeptide repeat protein [Dehalococcoidia bacterium]
MAPLWTFCAGCGAPIERANQEPAGIQPDELSVRALRLIGEGFPGEAEELLVAGLDDAGPDAHLLYARLLMERNDFGLARAHFDVAVRMAPANFMVRVRRAEFFSRYGLYGDALAEAEEARKLAPDVGSLIHIQDVERRLAERARGSFVVSSQLPSAPRWLRSLYRQIRRPVVPNGA